MSGDNIVYLNGTFEPEGEAKVPVTERGFSAATGCMRSPAHSGTNYSGSTITSTGFSGLWLTCEST